MDKKSKLIPTVVRLTEKNRKFVKRYSKKTGFGEGETIRRALDHLEADTVTDDKK